MTTTLLHAGRAFTSSGELHDAAIVTRDGVIESVGPRSGVSLPAGATEVQATDQIATPGFVDVHIHGAGGHDVMEATDDALQAVSKMIASHGTTSFLATTVTANPDAICKSSEGIAKYIAMQHQSPDSRAEVLGIHFEGPFISPVRRGVHPPEWIHLPSADMLAQFIQAAGGHAQLITIAPELLGATPCIEAARNAGLVVGMGHTDANYEQARAAIAHGVHHAIHVYNAMRPFSHRDSGVIGAVLTSPEVTAELIADGIHVEDIAMKMLLQAKGAAGVILISDGTAATGMPDGERRSLPQLGRKACRQRVDAGPLAAQHCEAGHSVGRCVADADAESGEAAGHRVQKRVVARGGGCGHRAAGRRAERDASLYARDRQLRRFALQSVC
jgi:N-acetylglucosamine-6-phosphate deacetylase